MKYSVFKEHLFGLHHWNKNVSNWYQLVWMKLGLKKSDFNLKFRNGLKMKLMNNGASSDTSVVREIWFEEIYNKHDFCDLKENAIILDLGANVGIFSLYIYNKNPTSNIYSYEASPLNYKYLKHNVIINNLKPNISVYNFAVTSKDSGFVKLYLHPRGSGCNSLLKETSKYFQDKHRIKTPQINLKKIIESNNLTEIDLLKIDIEGSEYDVLMNTDDETFSKIQKFVFELHNIKKYSRSDLIKFLESKGFMIQEYSGIFYGYNLLKQTNGK